MRPPRRTPRLPERQPRQPRRRRYVRPFEERCSFYVKGEVVLVVKENTIVTVIPRSWV